MKLKSQGIALLFSGMFLSLCFQANSQEVLSPAELLQLESMGGLEVNPVRDELIYSVSTPRGPNEDPGGSRTRYFRDAPSFAAPEPLFSGDIKGRSPQYSPDGEHIGFLYAEKEGTSQVWMMDLAGKQMKKLTHEASGVSSFQWQPGKQGIAYLTSSPETAREKALKDRGYDFIYYEENLKEQPPAPGLVRRTMGTDRHLAIDRRHACLGFCLQCPGHPDRGFSLPQKPD
jgi:dipeptidyl aminopeptidase/acylaminoacyl peptidase